MTVVAGAALVVISALIVAVAGRAYGNWFERTHHYRLGAPRRTSPVGQNSFYSVLGSIIGATLSLPMVLGFAMMTRSELVPWSLAIGIVVWMIAAETRLFQRSGRQ